MIKINSKEYLEEKYRYGSELGDVCNEYGELIIKEIFDMFNDCFDLDDFINATENLEIMHKTKIGKDGNSNRT